MEIPDHFPEVETLGLAVMPDHVQGILNIHKTNEQNGNHENGDGEYGQGLNDQNRHESDMGNNHASHIRNRHACSLQLKLARSHQKLPVVIGSFKSAVTRLIRKSDYDKYFSWQKSYHDRIVRNEEELKAIIEYI